MSEAALSTHREHRKLPRGFWPGICLFLLAAIPFLPAIHGQFTWDDNVSLTDSAAVHAWNGLSVLWNPFRTDMQFFPLTFSSYWLEHKLWGLECTGYHLDNMLLQAGAAVVLWKVLRRLGFKMAWLAALVWAIHPIQAESVAWVAERKNTLSGVFYFLAALAYLRFERVGDEPGARRQWSFYGLALFAFLAAMLAKSVTCTLPAGILLVLWWKYRKLTWRMIWPLVPVFILAFGFACVTAIHERAMAGAGPGFSFTWAERCIIAGKDVWFYLWTLIAPYPSMPVYPRWTYHVSLLNIAAPLLLVALTTSLFMLRKRIGIGPFLALAFFVVTASPILGFIDFYTMHFTFVADHFQYLACAGILVPGVELAARAFERLRLRDKLLKTLARICAASYVLVLGLLCAFYASLYQTNLKLWSWNVAQNPSAFIAQQILSHAYFELHHIPEAYEHINIALAQAPDDYAVQTWAGNMDLAQHRYPEALGHFEQASAIRPDLGIPHLWIGDALMGLHDLSRALPEFKKAVELSPGEPTEYFRYADVLVIAHQPEEAAKMYTIGFVLAPGNMVARFRYGNLLFDMGCLPEAIAQYEFVVKYDATSSVVWDNLAAAYYQTGQMEKAVAAKRRAGALDAQLQASPQQPASASEP